MRQATSSRYKKLHPLAGESSSQHQQHQLLKLPGRETSAGRALFALFNGYDLARKRGNLYSEHNAACIRRRPLNWRPRELQTPPRPEPQKRTIKVPQFRRRQTINTSDLEPHRAIGRRKASDILRQLQIDLEHKELPPQPTTEPLLDDKEKARLASLFEWSGRLDKDQLMANMGTFTGQTAKLKHGLRVQKASKGSVQEMENMVDQIAKEVAEREEFIRDMDQLGQAEKYKTQIQFEIQQRVKEMQMLDKLIKAEENK